MVQAALLLLGILVLGVLGEVAVGAGLLDGLGVGGDGDGEQGVELLLQQVVAVVGGDALQRLLLLGLLAGAALLHHGTSLGEETHDLHQQRLLFAGVQQRDALDAAHQVPDGVVVAVAHDGALEGAVVQEELMEIALALQVVSLQVLVEGLEEEVAVGEVLLLRLLGAGLPQPGVVVGGGLVLLEVLEDAVHEGLLVLGGGEELFGVRPQAEGHLEGGVNQELASGDLAGQVHPGCDLLAGELVGDLHEELHVLP